MQYDGIKGALNVAQSPSETNGLIDLTEQAQQCQDFRINELKRILEVVESSTDEVKITAIKAVYGGFAQPHPWQVQPQPWRPFDCR